MYPNRSSYQPDPPASFAALLYRFFFFDWLFADLSKATSLIERHAAWQHNREMRKYLPTYLRRWGTVGSGTFLTGCLCDRVLQSDLAASCCFTGFGAVVGVMTIIVVTWIFMANLERI